jgi:cation:H+ antiporter
MTTAALGATGLAIGGALGGLTVQTAFLAFADLAYRRANLKHAAFPVDPTGPRAHLVTTRPAGSP